VPIFIGRGAPVYDFARYDTTLPLVILATPAASPCIIMGARGAFLYSVDNRIRNYLDFPLG
jgi:hypothetical protein